MTGIMGKRERQIVVFSACKMPRLRREILNQQMRAAGVTPQQVAEQTPTAVNKPQVGSRHVPSD